MLGADLVKYLEKKYKVIRRTHQDCDIRDGKKVLALFQKYRPWTAIHAAGFTDVDGCEKDNKLAFSVNAQGTANVAKAAKSTDTILVYISSDYVFSGKKKTPYTEKDRVYPLNIYGKSKLEGEKSVRKLLKGISFSAPPGSLAGQEGILLIMSYPGLKKKRDTDY